MFNPDEKMGAGLALSPYQEKCMHLKAVENDYMCADARLFKLERALEILNVNLARLEEENRSLLNSQK
jgi:hypothetical protein